MTDATRPTNLIQFYQVYITFGLANKRMAVLRNTKKNARLSQPDLDRQILHALHVLYSRVEYILAS